MGSGDDRSVTIEGNENDSKKIDPVKSRFPFCIVWTPMPVLSWFFPCIGHIGICRDDGVILDFAGPNYVGVDNFAFGAPARYLQINKDQCRSILGSPVQNPGGETVEAPQDVDKKETVESGDGKETMTWDEALNKSILEFQNRSYNILTCNCHSFVANCLNRLKFQGGNWNVANLAALIFAKGRNVDRSSIRRTYLPFVVVFILGFILGGDFFISLLFLFILFIVGWFVIGSYCSKNLICV